MPRHWAVDALAASDVPQKRATVHAREASHSPMDKDVDARMVYVVRGADLSLSSRVAKEGDWRAVVGRRRL